MSVKIKASHVIKPTQPSWSGILPLSELDQVSTFPYVCVIYFYDSSSTKGCDNIIETLKNSLGSVLVPFYPLAGRLQWASNKGRLELELHCNAMGVELIEAESSSDLIKIGDLSCCKTFGNFLPHLDYRKSIQELPLLLVQLTRFFCGGVGLGIMMSHAVTDGLGAYNFFMEWTKFARNEPLAVLPYIDRQILQGGIETLKEVDDFSELPTLMGKEGDIEERRKERVVEMIVMTKDEVEKLRNIANMEIESDKERRYSSFEVVTAHVWRCACKARELKSEQKTALCFCVDARSRMDPPLPSRYFGNAIVDVVSISTSGELISSSLSHACQLIRVANKKVNNEYVRSLIKFLKSQKNLSKYHDQAAPGSLEGVFYGNPNLVVASWLNLPIHGMDFGWGKEIYMGPEPQDHFDGDITLLPSYKSDGSIVVVIGLQLTHMEKFKILFYHDIESRET